MSRNLAERLFITEADYLASETLVTEKHEYLNGFVYPLHWNPITNMAGATDAHVKVTGNAHYALKTHLRNSGCSFYISDMRLKIDTSDKAYFYPDVMVTCNPDDRQHTTIKYAPILVIEVLSDSTKDYDKGGKFDAYRQLTSLREYVLIDPKHYLVQVFRFNEHQRWELFNFTGENSTVELTSVGLICPITDFYEDVDFPLCQRQKQLLDNP